MKSLISCYPVKKYVTMIEWYKQPLRSARWNDMEDKFARLSALKPMVRQPAAMVTDGAAARLMALLGAELRTNDQGQHIGLRRTVSEPRAFNPNLRTLRLLAPTAQQIEADPKSWLFLDTETTGLAGGTGTYAFLIGIAWWEEGGFAVEQLFMRDHSEEASLLLGLERLLEGRKVLVTFNGKSFDWPLLETRFRVTRRTGLARIPVHLDLLHPARRLWRWRMKSVALSEIERQVLCLDRGADIPSETIPARYFSFLRGGPAEPIAEVFRHNQLDLCGLASLATHLMRLLEEPHEAGGDASALFGISRLLQQRGELPLAGELFERALSEGLPEIAERLARRELALMAKRRSDFGRAEYLWKELLGDTNEGLEAFEELAKHYEHRMHQPRIAAVWTRQALNSLREALCANRITQQAFRQWHARFQHRLDRLLEKLQSPTGS